MKAAVSLPAPNAPSEPFLRVVLVLVSGIVINAARLAIKFRRYLGIGIYANPYAILFMLFGAAVCGAPLASQGFLKSVPFSPLVADLSGIFGVLVLPAILPKKRVPAAAGESAPAMPGLSGSSSIFGLFFEQEISLRLQMRMQIQVLSACRRYSWRIIKVAAVRALADEMAIRKLDHADVEAVNLSIANIPGDADTVQIQIDKYQTLMVLLRCISFRLLFHSLALAQEEIQP